MNNRRKCIAVDFDGVIAEYDGWAGPGVLGAPREDVKAVLLRLQCEGWKVVVHTTRSEGDVEPYLATHGIPFDEINRNSDYSTGAYKPVATVYWDDRSLRYTGDAATDYSAITNFRTWSGRE